jgi:hypothetical protein
MESIQENDSKIAGDAEIERKELHLRHAALENQLRSKNKSRR